MRKIKKVILTIDYELFLGNKTGSVLECMIYPTEKLALILEQNNSEMTVFWDILHYYRLTELSKKYPELEKDRRAIKSQIQDFIKRGHDIQLHLHPHWLDAKYKNGKWIFNYKRFSLHKLSKEDDKEDINTIVGCIAIGKKIIENVCREIIPDYRVNAFRAGGYLIEPFSEIKEALKINNINIDSSVCPDLKNMNGIFSYNFTGIPHNVAYNFDENIREMKKEGYFKELPIGSIKISVLRNICFIILRRLKYNKLEAERKGIGSGKINSYSYPNYFRKLLKILFKQKIQMFTTDSSFKEKYNYVLKKVPNNSVQILHPKLLNEHTLNVIEDNLEKEKVKFVSINGFLNE